MPQNFTMNDQMIASDLLISAKAGVKCSAIALTECATPEVRNMVKKQLNDAISFHEKVFDYMMNKGLYSPYDVKKQIQMDMTNAQAVLGTQSDAFSV